MNMTTTMRKVITDTMRKTAAPELPAHLRFASESAKAALDAAKTPAEKATARRQGQQAVELLKGHVAAINVQAEFRKAHLKPLDVRKDFGR